MEHRAGFYEIYIKRLLDIILSGLALLILSPLMLIVAILVRSKLGTPVIFCQERPGKNEKIFRLYKFRSMTDARNMDGELLPDEMRLTQFGERLRGTSLDELPELWNILKGDMSLVGPRPLLPKDVAYMDTVQKMRHCVRPGLTGLAQCGGRNTLNWDTKLSTDVEYINKISFILDLRIICQTAIKVLKQEGIVFEEGTDMDLQEWNALKNAENGSRE